jgi:hypothetical protein
MISMLVKMAPAAATKEDVCGKPLMNALIAAKEVETSTTKMEKTTDKASHTPSLSRHSSPIVSKGNGIPIDAYEFTNELLGSLHISV